MITAEQLTAIKALGYQLEPDDEHAFIDFMNLNFPQMELKELLDPLARILTPCTTPPEDKKLHFLKTAEPWLRIHLVGLFLLRTGLYLVSWTTYYGRCIGTEE